MESHDALRGYARAFLRMCGQQLAPDRPRTGPRFVGPAAKELEQAYARCGRESGIPSGILYTGPRRLEDAAVDDPHPASFMVVQVGILLKDLGHPYGQVFEHVFVFDRHPRSFRFDCTSMVEDMVSELALRLQNKGGQSIVQSAVDAYNRYQKMQRRKAQQRAWEEANRPSKRQLAEAA